MNNIVHKIIILLITFGLSVGGSQARAAQVGKASFYADKFDGRRTASGAIFRQNKLTAAHRKFPFGTRVKVTNLSNNKSVIVVVNDRGPFVKSRIIDLSKRGARKLGFIKKGVARVKVEVLGSSTVTKKMVTKTIIKKTPVAYKKPTQKLVLESLENEVRVNKEKAVKQIPKTEISDGDFYEVSTKKVQPKGFAVQVASYKDLAYLIKHCDEIQNKINKKILVKIIETNGQKTYRLMIGSFTTREQAINFNETLKNKRSEGIVIAL